MLALVLMVAAGATSFVAQDIPGLGIQNEDPDTLDRYWKYRKADVDGNGTLDLLLPEHVLFLKDGRFSTSTPYPVKPGEPRPTADLWQGELYLRYRDRLEIHAWEEGRWRQRHAQPVAWPDPDPSFPTPDPDEQERQPEPPGIRFTRFLHDVDSDGAPEIALASRDGIRVYRRKDGNYAAAGMLEVYPPMRPHALIQDPRGYLANTPSRRMECKVRLSNSDLVVTEPERLEGGDYRYNVARYRVRLHDNGAEAEQTQKSVVGPLPARMFPTRLNGDDTLDFAGFEGWMSDSSAAPVPICIGNFSTDGGKTVQSVRTTATDNGIIPLDADGDGDEDLFVLRQRMFEGGTREIVTRAVTDRWVAHDVSVYLQDAQGRFATEPAMQWRGRIELDAPPWRASPLFMDYVGGLLFNFTGDFNGDGRLDILTQDRPNRLAVYLATGDTFQSEPEATIPTEPEVLFGAGDIDSDGRSDVILEDYPKPGQTRVCFSREGQP